jgi:diacylglycerol kinase (ATP)
MSEPLIGVGQRNPLTFAGRLRSMKHAVRGIGIMVGSQPNAWIHALATVVVAAVGCVIPLSAAEWCWIVLAIMAVWTAEALNTALEFLTDVASPTFHPVAGKAKDVAAGAVLIAAVGAALIGALVLGPHVARWISS